MARRGSEVLRHLVEMQHEQPRDRLAAPPRDPKLEVFPGPEVTGDGPEELTRLGETSDCAHVLLMDLVQVRPGGRIDIDLDSGPLALTYVSPRAGFGEREDPPLVGLSGHCRH